MKRNFAGPSMIKDEMRVATRKMEIGKAKSLYSISMEVLEVFEGYGIDKIAKLFNEIYDTCQIPSRISKSIFIALTKEPGATQCKIISN